MRFGGGGWRPNNRRGRRRDGGTGRSAEKGSDRTFIVALILFTVAVLGLMLAFIIFAY